MIGETVPNELAAEFRRLYGSEPAIVAQAPGRVDLMGSHTDYNQGFVLTLPINRFTWIAARPRPDRCVTIYSRTLEDGCSFSLDRIDHDIAHPWSDYVRGVAHVLQSAGYRLAGFDGLIDSSVPLSSGLSSSAALEVATARLFQSISGLEIDPVRLAQLCQKAENEFVGMNCGILDQYTASVGEVGNALLLDCRDLTSRQVALPEDVAIVICDTQAKRQLTGSEYPERRLQCEQGAAFFASRYAGVLTLRDVSLEQLQAHAGELPPPVPDRCRFIIEENRRVLELSRALADSDRESICRLSQESFAGARHLYQIASPEMDAMMAAMLSAPGAIGARQAGAGFGGCMVAFVKLTAYAAFARHVEADYRRRTGIRPRVFPVSGEGERG